jgi:Barstar, RNAse (barnase) inhibitor
MNIDDGVVSSQNEDKAEFSRDDEIYDNPFDESFYALPEADTEISNDSETDVSGSERNITIDFVGVSDKEEFHNRIKEAIQVPDYYGNNLDALYDILTEELNEAVIRILGINKMDPSMNDYIKRFRRMCSDICEENDEIKIIFVEDRL